MGYNMFRSAASTTLPVFLSVLCDNLLLTVVVPILPELLREKGNGSNFIGIGTSGALNSENGTSSGLTSSSCLKELFHLHLLEENSQLGVLYSTKAFVQLITNPLVGNLTLRIGYKIPLCLGNVVLFFCSLVFGFADSYGLYTIGRSCHGLASSLISISGMALVAECYQEDEHNRTKFLGRAMAAAALGVLIGYPFGGITFAMFGKAMPFICISVLAGVNVVLQLTRLAIDYHMSKLKDCPSFNSSLTELTPIKTGEIPTVGSASILSLLKDRSILIIVISVWLTTTAMAVLEPTLPVWLIDTVDPPKWQLGLVFVPDSLGYFIGTNYFGQIALRYGRWKMSMVSMAVIGMACFVLPMAKKVWQLTLPHFSLGLGLGIVDASLMPLLACLADENHHAGYGVVYALAQTSVALAYSLGPLIGGELVPLIGFPDLIRTVGLINLLFCPLISLLANTESYSTTVHHQSQFQPLQHFSISKDFRLRSIDTSVQPTDSPYQRFHDELDSD